MIMRFNPQLALVISFLVSEVDASAFNFQFFDALGDVIGSGTYVFDPIPENTNTVFNDLSNLDWSFELPAYGIFISSAEGDSSSRESTTQEGVYTTIVGSHLQLRFFDNAGSYISHNDESVLPLRTSVRFLEFSNSVEYIKDDVSLGIGSFEAVLVPEPSIYSLVCGMFVLAASVGYSGRRRQL